MCSFQAQSAVGGIPTSSTPCRADSSLSRSPMFPWRLKDEVLRGHGESQVFEVGLLLEDVSVLRALQEFSCWDCTFCSVEMVLPKAGSSRLV